MKPSCWRVVLSMILMGLGTPNTRAQALTPSGITYTYTLEENSQTKLCEIILDLESPVAPELIEFTAFAGYGKVDKTVAVGFIAVAGKLIGADDFSQIPLSDAAFVSKTFQSKDRLDYEVRNNGSFMAATDNRGAAGDFLRAFFAGNFEIRLESREPAASSSSYAISEGPPAEAQDRFGTCVEHLIYPAVSSL